jgi:hypothetical protein
MVYEGSEEDVKLIGRFVARNWEAFPEGSVELRDALERDRGRGEVDPVGERTVQGGVSESGVGSGENAAPVVGNGNAALDSKGSATVGGGRERPATILDALNKLDAKNDLHWTALGLPRVDVIAGMLGDDRIGRVEIDAALPGFTREMAAA